MHLRHLHAVAVSAALVAGCDATEPKPAPRMATANMFASDAMMSPRPVVVAPPREDRASPTSGSIQIDDKILRACGNLPVARFAFDSASIQGEAAFALDALARCFTAGPLTGRGMMLTGHTDSRGEVEYNMALGHRRAGNVAAYLEGRGISRAHLTTTSHGEFDATGTDEAGWALDRKVDVALVE